VIFRSQVPLGELRTDSGAPMMTFSVELGTPGELLKVNPTNIIYGPSSLTMTMNIFLKLLYEGEPMAHSALWSPFYEGDWLPKEDLLNDNLVRRLLEDRRSLYIEQLNWRHAKDVAYKKEFILDRPDWEFFDQRFSAPPERHELPVLGTDPNIYNKLIEQYYQ
jgi:hypothetical protein